MTLTMEQIEAAVEEVKIYYSGLLLNQYQKPKAIATIKTLADASFMDNVVNQIDNSFDLDTAVGVQLDILGEYIGQSRRVPVEIPRPYFEYDDYEVPLPNPVGFTSYLDPNLNADSVFYKYIFANQDTQILDDDEYRSLLLLKAALNTSDLTTAAVFEIVDTFFQDEVSVFDNMNMSLTYYINPNAGRLVELALDVGLLPKPMGVRIQAIFNIPDPSSIYSITDYGSEFFPDDGLNDYNSPDNGKVFLDYRNAL